jgi:Flp pilus assembly protein TadG
MKNPKRRIRGAAMIEFSLLIPVWLTLLLGTFWFGSTMIRGIQVNQIARDAASIFARGATDFSVAAGNSPDATKFQILSDMASGVGSLDPNSGNGVMIFSQLTYAGDNVCQLTGSSTYYKATNMPAHMCLSAATNGNQFVFTQQYVVGNASLHASMWGTPPTTEINSGNHYTIPMTNGTTGGYLLNIADRLNNFNLLPVPDQLLTGSQDGYQSGQPAFAVEVFFSSLVGSKFQGGNYAYSIF